MAATAPAAAADSYTVPDWIERNSQLFRARPPGVPDRRNIVRSNIVAAVMKSAVAGDDGGERKGGEEEEGYAASCMAAMLLNTSKGSGWLDAPAGLQSASYFREVSNHPNILATIVYTARRKAGFLPSEMGQQLNQEEWKDYINKFNAWLAELDAFWFYIKLINQEVESMPNKPATSDAVVDALSKFVLTGVNEVEDEGKIEVAERIKSTFELAAEYMVEKNITEPTTDPTQVVQASFQHEAFGIPGPSNPILPISFSFITLAKSNKKNDASSTIQYGSVTMNRFTFQLNSANVIANAETLAKGTTLLSTKDYCDYINGPLDEWAKGADTPTNTNT